MTFPNYNYYIGGMVRVLDSHTPYQQGEVFKVCYLSENNEGDKYIGLSDYMEEGNWSARHFEPVARNERDEYVREINDGPTIQVDLKEFNQMLVECQWYAAMVNCKVQDWCDFPSVVEEFNRLEREE